MKNVRPPLHPVDPWRIRETAFDPAAAGRSETTFALANGHLGIRGTLEEDAGNATPGTYVNGFHEQAPIVYGEIAFGFARNHQVLLNVADATRIALVVGGEPLDLTTGTIVRHERTLDLRAGTLARLTRWRSPAGHLVELESTRLVSFGRPNVAAIRYRVRLPESGAPVRILSAINGRVRNEEGGDDPRVGSHLPEGALQTLRTEASGTWAAVSQRTLATRLALVAGVDHAFHGRAPDRLTASASPDGTALDVAVDLAPGEELTFDKFLAYVSSLEAPEVDLAGRTRAAIEAARDAGFERLAAEQRAALDRFWEASDIEIDGDEALQQGVRYNLFSLFQSAGRDGRTSLAAKGLTGEGYEGHYFWDAEVFALPFFTYTQPEIARSMLDFRVATLDRARARAAELSQRGALYPWRTINGDEASAYFPAGTAQYHINADIAYGIRLYAAVTGDHAFLRDGGAAVAFETARLWADLGDYVPAQDDAFCLNEVTGPDEYTALVNNNAYTNLMARENLWYAADLAADLAASDPEAFAALAAEIGLTEEEPIAWRRAADAMRIPRDPNLGITAQDDSFLTRARWDIAATPPDRFPLLLHYHPLVIYRHQVLKQPDVVLAQVLLGSRFSMAEKRRNFDYYDPLTTGDSSLAPCIQSVAAAELGYEDVAYDYFMRTARMDLDDLNGNVAHGVHVAAMAGSWISLVYGFGGLRDDDGSLSFAPRLPSAWERLRFRLRVGAATLQVTITQAEACYEILAGEAVHLRHFGRPVTVGAGEPVRLSLRPHLEAVIFDLDGVITDTAEHHFRAWKRLAAEIAVPFDRELNERLKGVSRMESLDIILVNADRSATLAERVRLADRKNAYFGELIAGITPADLLPGVGELLATLRAHGIRTAIASMSHNVWEVVGRLGIQPLVDVIVDPASLVKGKPDPEIFLRAAEALAVRFENCIGIEDARAGVEAINAARMISVGVGRDLAAACWQVSDTRQLTVEALEALFVPPGPASAAPGLPATTESPPG